MTIDGTFTATTGMLDLNGVTPQTLGGTAAIALYDLTVDNSAGVTQTTTVSAGGTLTLNGPLDFAGESLSIANVIAGTPNDLSGDGASILIINGTGAGIVIPSSIGTLLDVAITNSNGAALAGPLTVGGTLTLAGGNLDAGSNTVSIGPAGSVLRTSGHVIGALEKWGAGRLGHRPHLRDRRRDHLCADRRDLWDGKRHGHADRLDHAR